MKNTQLTQEGFQNLERELDQLKKNKRPIAVERLAKARSMGDLSENSEYVAAKEELSFIDGRILEVEEILKTAAVVDTQTDNHTVSIGNKVTIQTNGTQEEYAIVGEFEADPMNKKLSASSPIAKALLGRKLNDEVEVKVPAGIAIYKIIEIT